METVSCKINPLALDIETVCALCPHIQTGYEHALCYNAHVVETNERHARAGTTNPKMGIVAYTCQTDFKKLRQELKGNPFSKIPNQNQIKQRSLGHGRTQFEEREGKREKEEMGRGRKGRERSREENGEWREGMERRRQKEKNKLL